METDRVSVDAECGACRGTGVYRGFAEPAGTGVVCLRCEGTGRKTIEYTPFKGRKRRDDVKTVCCSTGTSVGMGVGGPVGDGIPYKEFFAGKMPSK